MAISKSKVLMLFIAFLFIGALLLSIFPPNAPRTFLNHRRAVQSMRSLSIAERSYAERHPETGFACNLRDLGEPRSLSTPQTGSIDQVLASGTKFFYHFEIACDQGPSQKTTDYTITAVPTDPGRTGLYALCTDQSGDIWYSANGSASDCLQSHKLIEQKYR